MGGLWIEKGAWKRPISRSLRYKTGDGKYASDVTVLSNCNGANGHVRAVSVCDVFRRRERTRVADMCAL